MSTIVSIWAAVALAVMIALTTAAGRLGRNRSGAWLVVLGLVLVTLEEPTLTLWLGMSGQRNDGDGVAGVVTAMTRAHVLDAGGYGIAAAVLLGWIAMTAFKRGEPWARRVLAWGLVVAAVTEAASTIFVYSRGLPVPDAAGAGGGGAGFGWQPLAVGLLAWAVGIWLVRAERSTRPGLAASSAGSRAS